MRFKALRSQLRVDDVDGAELDAFLLSHFGSSSIFGKTATYPKDGTNRFALKFTYGKRGAVSSVVAGPLLDANKLRELQQRLDDDLVREYPQRVGRVICFSSFPVEGSFKYRDLLQLSPVPEGAPRNDRDGLFAEYPFMLEYGYAPSPNFDVNLLRRRDREQTYGLLLNSLLFPGIRVNESTSQFRWVIIESSPRLRVAPRQEMYWWDGFVADSDSYAEPAVGPLPLRAPEGYYLKGGVRGVSGGETQELPSSIVHQIDSFRSLPTPMQNRYLRACHWFQVSTKLWPISRSAGFTSLVSSIECLASTKPRSGANCESCKQPTGEGPTQMFSAFLERYAGSLSKASRSLIYDVRSRLVHGSHLMHADEARGFLDFRPGPLSERDLYDDVRAIVQACLVNWLASPPSE